MRDGDSDRAAEDMIRQNRLRNFAITIEPCKGPVFAGEKIFRLTYNGHQDVPIALAPHEAKALYTLLAAEFGL
jgi:hypothetical protein